MEGGGPFATRRGKDSHGTTDWQKQHQNLKTCSCIFKMCFNGIFQSDFRHSFQRFSKHQRLQGFKVSQAPLPLSRTPLMYAAGAGVCQAVRSLGVQGYVAASELSTFLYFLRMIRGTCVSNSYSKQKTFICPSLCHNTAWHFEIY